MKLTVENKREKVLSSWLVGVVLSCGVRARKALFYKAFTGPYFLSGSVKNRHFESKGCSEMNVGDREKLEISDSRKYRNLIKL